MIQLRGMKRYLSFFLLSAALGIAPGPDILFVFAQSLAEGPSAGALVTLGLATGLLVHISLAAFGFAAVMKKCPRAFTAITWCGAAYLAYLGMMAWRSAAVVPVDASAEAVALPPLRLYLQGVIMNLCNPKVILFFIALMPRFIDPSKGGDARQFIKLGLVFIAATLLVFNTVSLLGGGVSRLLGGNPGACGALRYAAALIMFALALWIAWMNLRGSRRPADTRD